MKTKNGDRIRIIKPIHEISSWAFKPEVGDICTAYINDKWLYGCIRAVPNDESDYERGMYTVLNEDEYELAENLAVGDQVEIISSAHNSRNEVGDIGVITGIDSNSVKVTVAGRADSANWHTHEELKLIKNKIKVMNIHDQVAKALNLKVGDVVTITHSVPNYYLGWGATWANDMNQAIGKTGKITEVLDGNSGFRVKIEGMSACVYPSLVLAKATFIEVKISNDYTAKIYPGSRIEVGCQTITPEILEQINKAFKS